MFWDAAEATWLKPSDPKMLYETKSQQTCCRVGDFSLSHSPDWNLMCLWVMTGKLETIKTQCNKILYVFFFFVFMGRNFPGHRYIRSL